MKIHELKTDPDVFEKSWWGTKNYEIRFNDRDYQEGDILYLRETKHTGEEMKSGISIYPLVYTDRSLLVKVQSILRGPIYGLQDGWVIMSTKRVRLVPYETNIDAYRHHKPWHEV